MQAAERISITNRNLSSKNRPNYILSKTDNAGSKMKSPIKISDKFPDTPKMPVLFLGHGSPMNAIEDNEFVRGYRKVSSEIAKPNAILCISAHWETRGTYFSASERPETIYDFYGFPKELYQIKYPAPGSPYLAFSAGKSIKKAEILMDPDRGLDHGAWSVIKHLYPQSFAPLPL